MGLGNKQRQFTRMIGLLIQYAYEQGYELTFGDAYRDPRVFGIHGSRMGYGRARSNHKLRLAVDFNLSKDGEFLTKTSGHQPLGEYWEDMGGSWGVAKKHTMTSRGFMSALMRRGIND